MQTETTYATAVFRHPETGQAVFAQWDGEDREKPRLLLVSKDRATIDHAAATIGSFGERVSDGMLVRHGGTLADADVVLRGIARDGWMGWC